MSVQSGTPPGGKAGVVDSINQSIKKEKQGRICRFCRRRPGAPRAFFFFGGQRAAGAGAREGGGLETKKRSGCVCVSRLSEGVRVRAWGPNGCFLFSIKVNTKAKKCSGASRRIKGKRRARGGRGRGGGVGGGGGVGCLAGCCPERGTKRRWGGGGGVGSAFCVCACEHLSRARAQAGARLCLGKKGGKGTARPEKRRGASLWVSVEGGHRRIFLGSVCTGGGDTARKQRMPRGGRGRG